MKSLRWRLAAWFSLSLIVILAVFVGFSHHILDVELHHKHWERDYPEHPDWKLHGSYSEDEIDDIHAEMISASLLCGVPLAVLAFFIGLALARKSFRPIAHLNAQLQTIRAPDLSRRIELPEADVELRGLVKHINESLTRVERAYTDMSEYAAKVAHELRTPLAILRLKVEQAGERIAPDLAEQLQTELHQLTHIVDQSLLIAKAEQGRLKQQLRTFDLAQLVADVAEDFTLLAQEAERMVQLAPMRPSPVYADPKHIRQILHNIFTNALKHGQGNIHIRLRPRPARFVLLIANGLRSGAMPKPETLGLGLRVVDTLLGLQPELKCRRRSGRRDYLVRLSFPAAILASEKLAEAVLRPMTDPGI